MIPGPLEVVRFVGRNSKRIAVSVLGAAFVLVGLAMLALPGPGLLMIAVGFAILGTEYAWAAAALERTKRTAGNASRVARNGVSIAGRTAGGPVRAAGRLLPTRRRRDSR